jgi:ADP-ribose pyrophosphatase YjhB (NUDIX family)
MLVAIRNVGEYPVSSNCSWLYGTTIADMSALSLHALSSVVAVRNGEILLQQGAYPGLEQWWSLLESNLKFGEAPEDCARRVLNEQAHVTVNNLRLLYIQSSLYKDVHWDLWFIYAAKVEGEPSPGEGNWKVQYFPLDQLPANVHPQDMPDIQQYARTIL